MSLFQYIQNISE